MQRSISYWYDYLINVKQQNSGLNDYLPLSDDAQTFLSDLTSTSKVARWRFTYWVVATGYFALDALMQLFFIDLKAMIESSQWGTLPWYISICKAYQHGDALVTDKLFTKYAVIDTTKQIVALAAAQGIEGVINLKVAKLVGGVPTQLTSLEETGFKAYIKSVKPPTVNVVVINLPSDQLRLYMEVIYDANVLTATGESILNPGVFPVEDKVNEYLALFGSDKGFNSYYELMRQVDYVQSAPEVIACYVLNASARDGANPFSNFAQRYNPKSGHLVIDPSTPLNTTITYTANV